MRDGRNRVVFLTTIAITLVYGHLFLSDYHGLLRFRRCEIVYAPCGHTACVDIRNGYFDKWLQWIDDGRYDAFCVGIKHLPSLLKDVSGGVLILAFGKRPGYDPDGLLMQWLDAMMTEQRCVLLCSSGSDGQKKSFDRWEWCVHGRASYRDGRLNGIAYEYYGPGFVLEEGPYLNGREIGIHVEYDEEGAIKKMRHYENGVEIPLVFSGEFQMTLKRVMGGDTPCGQDSRGGGRGCNR